MCGCGFTAKNQHGLSIHSSRMHKNETSGNVNIAPQPLLDVGDPAFDDVELFGVLLSKCRSSIPVVRIIQKSVRFGVSQELSKSIDCALNKNDITSWFRLLAFTYIVLRCDTKKSSNGPNIIRSNLSDFAKITNVNKFLSQLLQNTTSRRIRKHSSEEHSSSAQHDFSETTNLMISKAINSFNLSSSGGVDGLRPRHVKDLLSFSSGDAAARLTTSIIRLVDVIKRGNIPLSLLRVFYSGSLSALNKDENDVRPIAVGLYWRRLARTVVCYENREI